MTQQAEWPHRGLYSPRAGAAVSDLELTLREPRPLAAPRKERWRALIEATAGRGDESDIIFLCELFELVDAGSRATFDVRCYSGPDMFGAASLDYVIRTEHLRLERVLEREISDSWQRVESSVNEIRITGMAAGVSLSWDGETGGSLGLRLTLSGIEARCAIAVLDLARGLFHDVRHVRTREPQGRPAPVPTTATPAVSAGLRAFDVAFFARLDPYMVWHDGTDTSIVRTLDGLTATEKREAERRLADALANGFDDRWILGLSHLGSRAGQAALTGLFDREVRPERRAGYAQAILSMDPGSPVRDRLADVLVSCVGTGEEVSVLATLKPILGTRAFRRAIPPDLEDALFRFVEHDDYLVRYHAAECLLAAHGLTPDIESHEAIFGDLANPGVDRRPSRLQKGRHRRAATRLRALCHDTASARDDARPPKPHAARKAVPPARRSRT